MFWLIYLKLNLFIVFDHMKTKQKENQAKVIQFINSMIAK